MISRKEVILRYVKIYCMSFAMCIVYIFFNFDMKYLWYDLLFLITILLMVIAYPLIRDVTEWDIYYGTVYPVYEKEGYSDAFFKNTIS